MVFHFSDLNGGDFAVATGANFQLGIDNVVIKFYCILNNNSCLIKNSI